MAKSKSGGLGKGLDALLSSTASETMQKTAVKNEPIEKAAEQVIENDFSEDIEEPEITNQPTRKNADRIQVFDEELEQLAAAEREAIRRKAENNKALNINESQAVPEWTTSEAKVEVSAEAAASAPVIERVPRKKPTKRTAAGEAIKNQNLNHTAEVVTENTNEVQINTIQEHAQSGNVEVAPQKKKKLNEDSEIVPIESIKPNPNQPRTRFNPEELEELAASIEKDGLLQPLLVRPLGDDIYEIIAGERRWHACRKAGLKEVPVRVKPVDDMQALELALVENIQRSDLNPIEEAYGYRRIMEHKKVTQSQLAQMVSKGRSTIANALRLLDLPEDAQQLLYEEKITAGHARAILSVPTAEGKQKLTDKLVAEKLSVRETENIARLLAGREKKDANASTRTPTPKEFKMVARQLKMKLETNVQVKTVQGKNKIVIEFKDTEDLERLYNIISGD